MGIGDPRVEVHMLGSAEQLVSALLLWVGLKVVVGVTMLALVLPFR